MQDPNNISPTDKKLDLVLRALHILIRTSYAPSEPGANLRHFDGLRRDIGPWLQDYSAAFSDGSEPGQTSHG